MNENQTKKSLVTPKNILRIMSLFVIIFVFCPSFLVSCSGQEVDVKVMTAVEGMSLYGETIVEPHPIMLICLLIPVAMLVLLFIKKLSDRINALIIAIIGVVDVVIWVIFRTTVKKFAEENLCSFKTTPWYVLNIIALVIIVLVSVLIYFKIMEMEKNLLTLFAGVDVQGKWNQMSDAVSTLKSNVTSNVANIKDNKEKIGFCYKCGKPLYYGCKFCTSCGTPISDSMLEEAEKVHKEAEAKRMAEEQARKEAEAKRIAEEQARKEAEAKRIAEEQARKEAEAKRIAEEQARKEAEAKKIAEEQIEIVPKTVMESDSNLSSETVVPEVRPLFCQQCGTRLEPDSMFCENCGTKVK